jgi:hypothetical protein
MTQGINVRNKRIACRRGYLGEPAIIEFVEHLTVECCSYQEVPGSILGGQILAWS